MCGEAEKASKMVTMLNSSEVSRILSPQNIDCTDNGKPCSSLITACHQILMFYLHRQFKCRLKKPSILYSHPVTFPRSTDTAIGLIIISAIYPSKVIPMRVKLSAITDVLSIQSMSVSVK